MSPWGVRLPSGTRAEDARQATCPAAAVSDEAADGATVAVVADGDGWKLTCSVHGVLDRGGPDEKKSLEIRAAWHVAEHDPARASTR